MYLFKVVWHGYGIRIFSIMGALKQHISFEQVEFNHEQGIMMITFTERQVSDHVVPDELEQYVRAIEFLCDNKYTPFLIDMTRAKGNAPIAIAKYFSSCSRLNKLRLVDVFVAKELGSILTLRSFKRIYDPLIPYKICSSYFEARKFCDQYVANY
ncbi:hypothetical protein [Gilvibacter sp.]|uniref:hypothetical protein n=2 Tax=Gilvibacter TaxID=379070 RepID=UPI0035BE2D55